MYFKIEKPVKNVRSSAKKNGAEGHWYFVTQEALLFKDGETYPDKLELTTLITDVEAVANAHQPYPVGDYVIPDHAWELRNGRNLTFDQGKLVPKQQRDIKAA
jgi:hypothetical protein